MTAIKLLYLTRLNSKSLDGNKGIGVYSVLISAIFFLGIVTSICIVLFIKGNMDDNNVFGKVILIVAFQTLIFVSLSFFNIDILPTWFTKKDKINDIFIHNFYKKSK